VKVKGNLSPQAQWQAQAGFFLGFTRTVFRSSINKLSASIIGTKEYAEGGMHVGRYNL